MNEFKGTKGEWMLTDIDHCAQYGYPIEVLGDSYPIADVNLDSQQTEAEWKANAQLISKAPELLSFINRISGEMLRNDFVLCEAWYDQARKLIKEATEVSND